MIIGKTFKFDAAHYLPDYKGKCANMHGHTWHLTVEVEGAVNPETGMVMDFNYLTQQVKEVLAVLDHQVLNASVSNPTCEELVRYLRRRIFESLSEANADLEVNIKLQEGEGGYARF